MPAGTVKDNSNKRSRKIVYSRSSTTVALPGTHTRAALAAALAEDERRMPSACDGLIEIEPRSELALIVCAGLLPGCTVTVCAPAPILPGAPQPASSGSTADSARSAAREPEGIRPIVSARAGPPQSAAR